MSIKNLSEPVRLEQLAEECRMAVDVLSATADDKSPHDCINCRHKDRTPGVYPCSQCEQRYSGMPSKWEPKEVDNETD